MSRVLWLGSSSHRRVFVASLVRVDDARRIISVATFVNRLVFCSRFRHCCGRAIPTVFQIQHAALGHTTALRSLVSALVSLSFIIVCIVRFDKLIPRVSLGRGTLDTAHSHLTPPDLHQQESQKTETAIFRNF